MRWKISSGRLAQNNFFATVFGLRQVWTNQLWFATTKTTFGNINYQHFASDSGQCHAPAPPHQNGPFLSKCLHQHSLLALCVKCWPKLGHTSQTASQENVSFLFLLQPIISVFISFLKVFSLYFDVVLERCAWFSDNTHLGSLKKFHEKPQEEIGSEFFGQERKMTP